MQRVRTTNRQSSWYTLYWQQPTAIIITKQRRIQLASPANEQMPDGWYKLLCTAWRTVCGNNEMRSLQHSTFVSPYVQTVATSRPLRYTTSSQSRKLNASPARDDSTGRQLDKLRQCHREKCDKAFTLSVRSVPQRLPATNSQVNRQNKQDKKDKENGIKD